MEKDPAIWSRWFARKIAEILGFAKTDKESDEAAPPNEAVSLFGEMTEDFRYLPLQQWNWVDHLARFLVVREIDPRQVGEGHATPAAPEGGRPPSLDQLREIRSYVAYLRSRYGREQPADESDEWSDEDRQDFADAVFRRLDEEDPYDWEEIAKDKEVS